MKSYLFLIISLIFSLPLMAQSNLKSEYYSQQGGDVTNIPGCGKSLKDIQFCAHAIRHISIGRSVGRNADDLDKLRLFAANIERAEVTDYTDDNAAHGSCETAMVYFKLKGTGQILRRTAYVGRCGTAGID